MNILITSAGRRVSLVLAFQEALKAHFPQAKVLAADANPHLSAACQIADESFSVPRLDHKDYISELIRKCLKNGVKLVIPTIDTELLLLAEHKEELVEHGIVPVISSVEFIHKCRDKRQIHEFFESCGIRVAKEYSKSNYTLPLFIKPIDGSRSVDTFTIKEESDLQPYHFENDKLMFLEYIDHDQFNEYTCDLYFGKDHKLKCAVPRKRIEVRDGEVNKGLTVKNELVDYIREHLDYIEGAVGCLTTQFFLHNHDKTIFGIEVNPRFGGGFPLSYHAGANFPDWLIREYLLDEPLAPQFESWESNLLMLRFDKEVLVHGFKH